MVLATECDDGAADNLHLLFTCTLSIGQWVLSEYSVGSQPECAFLMKQWASRVFCFPVNANAARSVLDREQYDVGHPVLYKGVDCTLEMCTSTTQKSRTV